MPEDLKRYVINLSEGYLSDSGAYQTTEADIDRIFSEHLPEYLRQTENPRIVVYAHGGLVDENAGLALARLHTPWWRENGIYPLYFTWETGPLETLWAVHRPHRRVTYGLEEVKEFAEETRDLLTEAFVRSIDGEKYWKKMKDWAAISVRQSGGATLVARKLKAFVNASDKPIPIHAIGHSAGAIFHSHFLPLCIASGLPVSSLQLFAPAIRVDDFQGRLMPLLGRGINDLTIYTMKDSAEKQDVCEYRGITLYGKSLLYLIYRSLEPEENCPLLGLEISLNDKQAVTDEVREALKLGQADTRVRWSPETGVTESRTHGGFDEDAATMQSAAKVILEGGGVKPFPRPGRRTRLTFGDTEALETTTGIESSGDDRKAKARVALLHAMQEFMDAYER